ncbi:MAG: 4-hydroxythreonine-4-phosphate dehydrogenase PdxA [Myxococcota bacterium]
MKPLAVAVGDPSGVGPAVTVEAVADAKDDAFVIFGDANWLETALARKGADRAQVTLEHVADWGELTRVHRPTKAGGAAQLASLNAAIDATLAGTTRALVTGPTSKEAIDSSGTPFVGQTEHLAAKAGQARDSVSMLFLGPRLNVALVTTHLSVRAAADAITPERVARTVRHLVDALQRLGHKHPTVSVTGLNPHAGEGGLFGHEEERAVRPVLTALSDLSATITGPTPAEAAFRAAADRRVDGVVAMIHDQATIASKLLDWGSAVNVTWGLPFVRTSVDHGVAYDAAAAGTASSSGMKAAVALAQRLVPARRIP